MIAINTPDGLPPLRDVIAEHGLSAKKSLGQNFLLNLNLTRKIARLAAPLSDTTVVEVGPGPGGLTRALLAEGAKRVIAVERDERCLPILSTISEHFENRLSVINGDALDVDWRGVLAEEIARGDRIVIAANLPYGVASQLLVNWLETEPWPPWWSQMVLMFQREVADRIVAASASKAYGRLSILSQWRCEARIALTLGPEAFTPPPKVSSAVVTFEPCAKLEPACSVKALGRVTAAAFGQRRKMLRQSLKQLTPMPELLLKSCDLDPQNRAENLDVSDFARLAAKLET
jgi:16S rRNA (adenine1518-N6/adenine1519-N6)-dimethyltransferase